MSYVRKLLYIRKQTILRRTNAFILATKSLVCLIICYPWTDNSLESNVKNCNNYLENSYSSFQTSFKVKSGNIFADWSCQLSGSTERRMVLNTKEVGSNSSNKYIIFSNSICLLPFVCRLFPFSYYKDWSKAVGQSSGLSKFVVFFQSAFLMHEKRCW